MTLSPNHWFVLGREPKISAAEIAAVLSLPNNKMQFLSEDVLSVNAPIEKKIINRLGGTIKIGEEIKTGMTEEELKEEIVVELRGLTGKIHFGISAYYPETRTVKNLPIQIKKLLKKEDRSVRYVPGGRDNQMSSAVTYHNRLTTKGREFLITKTNNGFALAKTVAIQPFEQLSNRDFGRPGRDDFSGMLPPKLAMIMINLSQATKNTALLDPFCGSGTILTEAMLMGYTNLIGTDISEKATKDTEENIKWLTKQYPSIEIKPNNIFQSDAKDLSQKLSYNSINTIVTEPYLGKPLRGSEDESEIIAQIKELKQLYIESFRSFEKILKKNGAIIFIIPRFFKHNHAITINCAPEIEKIGFKTVPLQQKQPYLLYGRPGQKVMREIWKFKKV